MAFLFATCWAAVALAGCASSSPVSPPGAAGGAASLGIAQIDSAATVVNERAPVLLAIGARAKNSPIEYWPLDPKGNNSPHELVSPAGIGQSPGMAVIGQKLAIANGNAIALYDLQTKTKSSLPDPYGYPIDVAVDKHGSVYAANISGKRPNVVMYAAASGPARELVCSLQRDASSIAVDDEGDIFVHQQGGVIEIPRGPNGPEPKSCRHLDLKTEPGYPAGLAVDPKTDDLVVLDDPDECAGGINGRMTIYPKPYAKATGISHDLGANCAAGLRLDATSTLVFTVDQDPSGSYNFILQATYPEGKRLGTYYGNKPGAFATIPSALPN
ncbi:MAG: hypothetical protein IAI50_03605 [Candidatus Eremiobacteraeota bacterium]|nr:hypothetical protein [Candidatus Eremiobacteraeota bacterium]